MAAANSINESTTGIVGFTGTAFTGTPVTAHDVLLGGATSSTIAQAAPSATSGVPLISQGASADPLFGTAVVAGGGTGAVTLTNHGVLIGQATSAIVATAAGSAGQVLQSGGASADPTYSTATYPATATSTGTILRADGTNWSATTATYPNTATVNQILYGSASNVISGLSTANNGVLITSNAGVPSILAESATAGIPLVSGGTGVPPAFTTAVVAGGGTGDTSFTAYSVITGGTTSTGALQNVSGVGTSGQVLTSNGPSALPTWQTPTSLLTATLTLTNAQLKALNSTPVQAIGAPGNGVVIVLVSITHKFVYGGTNVFTNAPNISYEYGSGGPSFVGYNLGTGFWQASNNVYNSFTSVTGSNIASTSAENAAIYVQAAANLTGNAANDNTVKIFMTYYTVTL